MKFDLDGDMGYHHKIEMTIEEAEGLVGDLQIAIEGCADCDRSDPRLFIDDDGSVVWYSY